MNNWCSCSECAYIYYHGLIPEHTSNMRGSIFFRVDSCFVLVLGVNGIYIYIYIEPTIWKHQGPSGGLVYLPLKLGRSTYTNVDVWTMSFTRLVKWAPETTPPINEQNGQCHPGQFSNHPNPTAPECLVVSQLYQCNLPTVLKALWYPLHMLTFSTLLYLTRSHIINNFYSIVGKLMCTIKVQHLKFSTTTNNKISNCN